MRKIWLAIAFALGASGVQAAGGIPIISKDSLDEQTITLTSLGRLIAQRHYSPRAVDDQFSKEVWTKYLDQLDPDHKYLLAEDISELEGYSTILDDEIRGVMPLQFLPYALEVVGARLEKVEVLYQQLLTQPFRLAANEGELGFNTHFLSDATDQRAYSRKYLKYLVLKKYLILSEERAQSHKGDSLYGRTDQGLESLARRKVASQVKRNFAQLRAGLDEGKQFTSYVNVIVHCMDPHSDYFPPAEQQAFADMMRNRLTGIGVELVDDNGLIRINGIEPGSPADRSGQIEVNDGILEVGEGITGEMVDVSGMLSREIVKLITGAKGTTVRLGLKSPGGPVRIVSMVRDEIVQEEGFVRAAVVKEGSKNIGYIRLPKFYADAKPDGVKCSKDVASAITRLKKERVDGIVLDLRTNGGGSLQEVIRMIGLFIKAGPVVQVRDREKTTVLPDVDSSVLYDGPLAVMVNEFSASASEIFAAAIQDYHRGVIIGSASTYGKGTVQTGVSLGQGQEGVVKLTTQKFYRISGGSTQLKGVSSDIVLPDLNDLGKIRERDGSSALPWDEVPKANYVLWDKQPDLLVLQVAEASRLAHDSAFAGIQQLSSLIVSAAFSRKVLDLNGYKEQERQRRAAMARYQRLQQLPSTQKMTVLPVGSGQDANYRKWLNKVETDIYLREAAAVIMDMQHS